MLDKSIPYKHVFMQASAQTIQNSSRPILPEGYRFKRYESGDEQYWAAIETSVLEFETETDALSYFAKEFGPYEAELKKRCVFVVDSTGVPVATATAWFDMGKLGRRATLHWVSVCPQHQGKGLGKAVVQEVLTIFAQLHPGESVWLHTQTWSHKAIRLYEKLGFRVVKTNPTLQEFFQYDPQEAFEVLRGVLEPAVISRLEHTMC